MFSKRVTILCGFEGCGKTHLAVAGARALAARGEAVTLVELDVAHPTLHRAAARRAVRDAGVEVIALDDAGLMTDQALLVARTRGALERATGRLVLDVGVHPASAAAFARTRDVARGAAPAVLVVTNACRPFTRDAAEIVAAVREVEAALGLAATGLVSNTHLGEETTVELVAEGAAEARAAGRSLGLPLVAVIAPRAADALRVCVAEPVLGLDDLAAATIAAPGARRAATRRGAGG